MKKLSQLHISRILPYIAAFICLVGLILYPEEIAISLKNGMLLLYNTIIPSLFPFMIVSLYISQSPLTHRLAEYTDKFSNKLFGISSKGLSAVLLGFCGGYPIGAKITSEYFQSGAVSESEAHKLLCWCVNPAPAFVITAVGRFMLGSTQAGVLMYICVILSSLTIGIFLKLAGKQNDVIQHNSPSVDSKNIFVNSVASGSGSMLSICGWVLTFSCISGGIDVFIKNESANLFIKTVLEVTTGCKNAVTCSLPIPLVCAVISFGGLAVIFQVAPYLEKCNFSIKLFISLRALNSALSAFYCSFILKIFKNSISVYSVIEIGNKSISLSHSITATVILIITCIVLILEVDYGKKMC